MIRTLLDVLKVSEQLRTEFRVLFRIGLPVVIGNMLQVSMSFVDTVMAGNLSPEDLASVAVGSSLMMPVFLTGLGIIMAVSPIVAQHFGARKLWEIGKTTRQSLWLAVFLGAIAMVLLRNTEPVLSWIGVDEALFPKTTGYTKAASWGMIPILIYMALRFFNEGLGITKPAMWISLIGLFFNIFGNYVFMYGKLGFPAMGAVGTGWATALVMTIMSLSMVVFVIREKSFLKFQIFQDFRLPNRTYMIELLRIGVPNGLSLCMEVTMFAVVALLIGSLGTLEVAAHQIALNFASVTFMLAMGLSAAVTVRVGQNYGAHGLAAARFSGRVGIGLTTLFMICTAILMFSLPHLIARIYTSDPDLISRSIALLYMAAVFQIFDGLQVSGSAALRGLKDTTIPMISNLISYWVVGLPLGYLLGIQLQWGTEGLWMGLIAGLTTAGILHNLRFYLYTKKMLT